MTFTQVSTDDRSRLKDIGFTVRKIRIVYTVQVTGILYKVPHGILRLLYTILLMEEEGRNRNRFRESIPAAARPESESESPWRSIDSGSLIETTLLHLH